MVGGIFADDFVIQPAWASAVMVFSKGYSGFRTRRKLFLEHLPWLISNRHELAIVSAVMNLRNCYTSIGVACDFRRQDVHDVRHLYDIFSKAIDRECRVVAKLKYIGYKKNSYHH